MRGREDVAAFVIVGLLNEMRPRRATMYTSLHVLISDDAHRMLESESFFMILGHPCSLVPRRLQSNITRAMLLASSLSGIVVGKHFEINLKSTNHYWESS